MVPMQTWISVENIPGLLALLIAIVALGIWMESKPKWAQFGVISIILAGALASGLGIAPRQAEPYRLITQYFVPLAIPLLLFNANLVRIWRESGRVFFAFVLAALGVFLGSWLAAPVTDFGPDDGIWRGILTAGYIGGSANTAAVAAAMDKTNDPFMAVAVASTYVVATPFLVFLLALPAMGKLWRWFSPTELTQASEVAPEHTTDRPITAFSMIASLALSALIFWISHWIAALTDSTPMLYVSLSLLSVLFATLLPKQATQLSGHLDLGRILIYTFFAVIGVQIDFALAYQSGGQIVLFSVILIVTHLVVLALGGRLLRLSGPELAVASNACVLGAPTAAAMAVSKGWHALTVPGLLVGILGYAIATLIGISLATWL